MHQLDSRYSDVISFKCNTWTYVQCTAHHSCPPRLGKLQAGSLSNMQHCTEGSSYQCMINIGSHDCIHAHAQALAKCFWTQWSDIVMTLRLSSRDR